jgi:hypothetical protein
MNSLKLSNYPNGYGVKAEINGIELQEVRDIQLTCNVAEAVVLRVEQVVHPELDVTLEGYVQPVMIFDTELLELHVEHIDSKHTRYWVTHR